MSVFRNLFKFNSTKSLGLLVLLGAFFLFPETVLADSNATTSDSFQDSLRGVAGFLAVLVRTMTFACLFIMDKGMHLMGTDLLIGPRAMEAIQPMWMFIRNLTNIAFVGVILFIAVYNLLKNGDGDWSIKSKLPKVIMALIAINFSLTAAKVAIEGVNVATIGVLSISDSAIEAKGITNLEEMLGKGVSREEPEKSAACPVYNLGEGDSFTPISGTGTSDAPADCKPFAVAINEGLCGGSNPTIATAKKECLLFINLSAAKDIDKKGDFGAGSEFKHNIFLAFGNHFLQLETLPLLAAELPDFLSIVDSIIFSFIMAAAYMVVFIALFAVLLFRVIALWAMMIFSPAIIAGAILGMPGTDKGLSEFIKYLVIPLKIGAVFALTFFMINMMVDYGSDMPIDQTFIQAGPAINQFYGHSGFGILWKIIILVAFWKAAFMALDGTAVDAVVQKVKSGAESVGKFGATYVASEVKVPTIEGKAGGATVLSMTKGLAGLRTEANRRHNEANQTAIGWWNPNDQVGKKVEDLKTDIKNRDENGNTYTPEAFGQEIQKIGFDGVARIDKASLVTMAGLINNKAIKDRVEANLDGLITAARSQDEGVFDRIIGEGKGTFSMTKEGTGVSRSTAESTPKNDITATQTNNFTIEAEDSGAEKKTVDFNLDRLEDFDSSAYKTVEHYKSFLESAGITATELSSFTEIEISRLAAKIVASPGQISTVSEKDITESLTQIKGTS